MSSINFQVFMNNSTITKTIITNVVKMLIYRGWIHNNNDISFVENLVNDLIKNKKEETIYNIKLSINLLNYDTYEQMEDKKNWKNFDGTQIYLFLSNQTITGKSQILIDFINKYNKYHKIIIVENITDKAKDTLMKNDYTEIFIENELMINLSEHIFSSQYIVLNSEEKEQLLKDYHLKKKELPKQHTSDPMSRYLFLKQGQIAKIIRNSQITAQSVYYRIIINK